MKQTEALWRALECSDVTGGSRRIDETHRADFYCSLGQRRQRGLVLISDVEPPLPPPTFDAVDIVVGHRMDGRWSLALWLKIPALAPLFAMLCDDLVFASREMNVPDVPAFVITRLLHWRRMLEAGRSNILDLPELRGLLGELVTMEECLKLWTALEVIDAWQGPFGAPHDFLLPTLIIEAKAITPMATLIRINSAEQLMAFDERSIHLAVITVSSQSSNVPGAFTVPDIIARIRAQLSGSPSCSVGFDDRLRAAGYIDHAEYERIYFRLESVAYFGVAPGFPYITRTELAAGISNIVYDIRLAACLAFRSSLEK